MAGTQFSVTIDDLAAQQALARLVQAGRDLSPAMDEIGGMLVASTLNRFERGVAPDGTPWEPSARARQGGGQTLIESGRLRDSVTHSYDSDQVTVGTNVVYAAIHQFGGTITPRDAQALVFNIPGVGWRRAQSVTIPARPFLGVSEGDRQEINAIVADHLQEAFR